jgi:hypothetical protein
MLRLVIKIMVSNSLISLSLDSSLDDLPSIDCSVQFDTKGENVMQLFNEKPENPGVIIVKGTDILGVISRETFFEHTGKRFGVEVFLNRPIQRMFEKYAVQPLILPASSKISQAAHQALKRDARSVYEPIVVEKTSRIFRLIDIFTVFLAENQILLNLHNQHTFTIASGMNIPDDEAIMRFSKFGDIPSDIDPLLFLIRHSVTCDHCSQKIEYSITDIVRSHPQLDRGIEIVKKMGSRTFTFYVRHTCGDVIREIPVQHDEDLKIRAVRPSRLVETYV